MIVPTRDWRRLIGECSPDDLSQWHADWRDINWPATLRQPDWHLVTDDRGSWALFEPFGDVLNGHLIIAPERRGRDGLRIARAMLDWVEVHIGKAIVATAGARKTRIFLRLIGFHPLDGQSSLIWIPNGAPTSR